MREMAEKLEVPITTYREWEYGREIKGEPYPKMARILSIGLWELLTGEAPSNKKALEDLNIAIKLLLSLRNEINSFS